MESKIGKETEMEKNISRGSHSAPKARVGVIADTIVGLVEDEEAD
jgi:hypothetical protein